MVWLIDNIVGGHDPTVLGMMHFDFFPPYARIGAIF